MNNEDVIKVIYEFIKTRIIVLDLSKFTLTDLEKNDIEETVTKVQNEIRKNKNKKDIKIKKLEDVLKGIFTKLQMAEYDSIDDLTDELRKAYEEAKRINEENERLSQTYGGSFAFVKTLSDSVFDTDIDRSDLEETLKIVYDSIKDTIYDDALIIQGKKGFVDSVKAKVTKTLLKNGLYKKVKRAYDGILGTLYTNLLLYKESI